MHLNFSLARVYSYQLDSVPFFFMMVVHGDRNSVIKRRTLGSRSLLVKKCLLNFTPSLDSDVRTGVEKTPAS